MAISVVCQKCGKGLKVKDEWAGRRATCPGCGATFIVTPPGATTSKPGATAFNPALAAQKAAERKKEAGSFSISPGVIIGGASLLLLCAVIGWFIMGPKKVWAQWEALGDKPNDDVINVVSRGLECYMQEQGMYNPRKGRGRPEAKEVMFYRPGFVMNMPDGVDFQGGSSVGPFKGVYHPKTGEVEATVSMGGGLGIPGSGGKTTAGAPIKITGRDLGNGKLETFVNGKKVELVMPPITDDDR